MPPKPAPKQSPNPKGKGKGKVKGKGKHGKQKRHKLNLKGWLKTAADWARFNAWAKINALPRKIPEPEPIVRESKPLNQLKKRLIVISQPSPKFNMEKVCRLDLSVSKAALKAKPSKRIKELANFVWKVQEPGKEVPNPITKAALNYNPSPRIQEIAKPHIHNVEGCHTLEISKNALKHKTTDRDKKMSLAKKVRDCPNSLTDKEIARIFTPTGIRKSALVYKITDWVSVLALPSYRFLKDRRDPVANEMKKQLEANEDRGKKVLEEYRKKEKEKAKKGEKNRSVYYEEAKKKKMSERDEKRAKAKEEKRKKERKKWRNQPGPCKTDMSIKKSTLNAKASERIEKMAKPHIHVSKSCRENPFGIKKSARQASASARTTKLAKPTHPSDPVERRPPRKRNTYGVPIFPKPIFGKKLPEVEPYKMGECKDKDEAEKEPEKPKKNYPAVPLFPSIDPCIDPIGAKRQAKARKAAAEAKKAEADEKKKKREELEGDKKPEKTI